MRRLREDGDARHLQTAIEVFGNAEELVWKDFVKDALPIASTAVCTRHDSFGYHAHERPIAVVGDERLSTPAGLPDRRSGKFGTHAGVETGEGVAPAQVLRRRVAVVRLSGTVRQAKLPNSAGDSAGLDHESLRTVLRDPRR